MHAILAITEKWLLLFIAIQDIAIQDIAKYKVQDIAIQDIAMQNIAMQNIAIQYITIQGIAMQNIAIQYITIQGIAIPLVVIIYIGIELTYDGIYLDTLTDLSKWRSFKLKMALDPVQKLVFPGDNRCLEQYSSINLKPHVYYNMTSNV